VETVRLTLFTTHRARMKAAVIAATVTAVGIASAATAAAVSDRAQPLPTFNGGVYALAYSGNTLYLGGAFTQVVWNGKRIDRQGLAAIDAKTGTLLSWAPKADGTVDALAVDPAHHTVYAGGRFTSVDGAARGHLAAINATTGAVTTFRHSVSGTPEALAVSGGRIYVGGAFAAVDGRGRSNLAAFSLSTGALDTRWTPTADDTVYAVAPASGRIYVGGKFRQIDGLSGTGKLAAVDPASGARIAAFHPSLSILVYSIAIGPGGVYAAEGGQGGRAVDYTTAGTPKWTFTTDGDIHAVTYLNGVLYTGGHYDNACKSAITGTHGFCVDGSIPRVKLAAVDAGTGTLLPWNPTGNGIHGVFALASDPSLDLVAASGEFTTINGASHGRFAQFH
jgi:hypothetical protein